MEKEQLKISIVVAVYNVEDYIKDCLDSLINQTYRNIEIILVDDGSTDLSGEICDEYSQNDERIIVVHKTNGGLVSARKAGIRKATGDYTTYVDSDDWIDVNAYDELVQLAMEYRPDIIAYDFIKEYSDFNVERIQPLPKGFYRREQFWMELENSIKENVFFCSGIHLILCSKMFKTELLKDWQLNVDEEICFGEDAAVVFPSLLKMENIYIVKRCFYHYRVRENSITRSKRKNEYYRYLKLVETFNEAKNSMTFCNTWVKKYLVYIIYYYLIVCVPQYCFEKNTKFFLFPKVEKGNRIIVYGKGVFANAIKNCMEQIRFCNIIDNLDRTDIARIKSMPEESYEFIIIAITDFSSVQKSRALLQGMGINRKKILNIQKDNLIIDNLPIEVRNILKME